MCVPHTWHHPTFSKHVTFLFVAGQNRGKASLEYVDAASARTAVSHMNGGQLDGAALKVEISDAPLRTRSRSPPFRPRNGRDRDREQRPRSPSPLRSRSRSRSPPPRFQRRERDFPARTGGYNDSS